MLSAPSGSGLRSALRTQLVLQRAPQWKARRGPDGSSLCCNGGSQQPGENLSTMHLTVGSVSWVSPRPGRSRSRPQAFLTDTEHSCSHGDKEDRRWVCTIQSTRRAWRTQALPWTSAEPPEMPWLEQDQTPTRHRSRESLATRLLRQPHSRHFQLRRRRLSLKTVAHWDKRRLMPRRSSWRRVRRHHRPPGRCLRHRLQSPHRCHRHRSRRRPQAGRRRRLQSRRLRHRLQPPHRHRGVHRRAGLGLRSQGHQLLLRLLPSRARPPTSLSWQASGQHLPEEQRRRSRHCSVGPECAGA